MVYFVSQSSSTEDVKHTLYDWTNGIMAASYQWWLMQLYLLWSHRRNTEDSRDPVLLALRHKRKHTHLPVRFVNQKRIQMLDSIIMLAETGQVVGTNKHKFKILYKNYYCHISPSYYQAYQRVTSAE